MFDISYISVNESRDTLVEHYNRATYATRILTETYLEPYAQTPYVSILIFNK
jgi:hypothetical protein